MNYLAIVLLIPVEKEVSVGPDAPRPLVRLGGPHGAVVVEVVGQVVGHQVLAAHPQVHRVPVLELPPHQAHVLLGDLAVLGHGLVLVEDKVPHLGGHVLGLDAVLVALVPLEGAALEDVRDGVVGVVDGRVGERLDQPAFVPWQLGPQAVGPRKLNVGS